MEIPRLEGTYLVKRLVNYIPVMLGIVFVSAAILLTGGFTVNNQYTLAEDTQPPETTVTDPHEVLALQEEPASLDDIYHILSLQERRQVGRPAPTDPSQELTTLSSTSPTSTSSTSSTSTSTTTTKATTVPTYNLGGRFSSIRVFIDLQRIIFYKVNPATGQEYEAYAVRCSTGTSRYPTPAPGPSRPYYLGGRKAALTIFRSTKSTIDCWVRYATHMSGSIWFHSVPYDYVGSRFDPSRCYMYSGYDVLGRRTSSHGCIRMALRDAQFLYNNTYRGMPCYVISSYSSAFPGRTPLGPAPLPPALGGSRNWDPTDPNYPGYSPPAPFPTVTDPTEPEATPATTVTETTTTTKPTTAAGTTTTSKKQSTTTTTTTTTTSTTPDPEPTDTDPTTTDPENTTTSTGGSENQPPEGEGSVG